MRTIQITLHDIRRSPSLSARIRELGERLENHWPEMIHCRVSVAQEAGPGPKERFFKVSIGVRLPACELAATARDAQDVYLALREAFDSMRRQLNEAAPTRRPIGRPPSTKAAPPETLTP